MRQLNGLRGNLLHTNQMLLVPVARETLADATLHAETRVAGMRDLHLAGGRIVHKVKNGETLWLIAKHYHVTVAAILHWNKFRSSRLLHAGDKLVIWRGHKLNDDDAGTST